MKCFKLTVVGLTLSLSLLTGCQKRADRISPATKDAVTALLKVKSEMDVGATFSQFRASLAGAKLAFENAGDITDKDLHADLHLSLESYLTANDLWADEKEAGGFEYAVPCSSYPTSGECKLHPQFTKDKTFDYPAAIQFYLKQGADSAVDAKTVLKENK